MNTQTDIPFPEELTSKLSEGLLLQYACIVYGSAGKSRLIKLVCPGAVICDAREITDPRTLSGYHAIVDGSITFSYGILIEAMRAGATICFKRIDMNTRLLHHLLPVIHNRRITAGNGEVVLAHEGFRLLFTSESIFDLRGVVFVGPVGFTYHEALTLFGGDSDYAARTIQFLLQTAISTCPGKKGHACDAVCIRDVPACFCSTAPFSDPAALLCGDHFRMLASISQMVQSEIANSNANRLQFYQAIVNILLRHDSQQLREYLSVTQEPLTLTNAGFAKTEPVESALRGILANIKAGRPTLLVGETGTGKTALVQYLCENSEHFLGKHAPEGKTHLKIINMSPDTDISELLGGYQSINLDLEIKKLYVGHGLKMPATTDRRQLLGLLRERYPEDPQVNFYLRVLDGKTPFYFREGVLTAAMRAGTWVLLDEINLASSEVLGMLEAVLSRGELVLPESGSLTPIRVHPDFRIFACMNPAGDFGKKAYYSRVFSTVFFRDFSMRLPCIRAVVETLSRGRLHMTDQIANFFYEFKQALANREYSNVIEPLVSGRTLCRAISLMLQMSHEETAVAAYRAFNLLFFTQLDISSRGRALSLFHRYFPQHVESPHQAKRLFDGIPSKFVMTPRMEIQVTDVELAIEASLPVLLQGDTSTGKTSLVMALAEKHGRRVIRINNHDQTEAADYLGQYITERDRIVTVN